MNRVGAVVAAAAALTMWCGPVAAADQQPAPPTSTKDVPISLENTTVPMPDPDTIDHLASTGTEVAWMFRTGIALVVTGALAVAVARRPEGPA